MMIRISFHISCLQSMVRGHVLFIIAFLEAHLFLFFFFKGLSTLYTKHIIGTHVLFGWTDRQRITIT